MTDSKVQFEDLEHDELVDLATTLSERLDEIRRDTHSQKQEIERLQTENKLLAEKANLWDRAKKVLYACSTGPWSGYYFTSDPVERFRYIPTLAEFVTEPIQ